MKYRFHRMLKQVSVGAVLIILTGVLTGCGLRDAIVNGFFGAIDDVVSTIVNGALLPGS